MGGTDPVDARGLSIATDASGNVYTTGFFTGSVDFDPGQGVFNLSPSGIEDLFISKLDSTGEFQWARQIDVIDNAPYLRGKAIAVDADGNVVITGSFSQTYGYGKDGTCFVARLNSAGNILWTKQLGVWSEGSSIRVDVPGNIYIGGLFSGEGDFDPGPGVFNLSTPSFFSTSFFVCKLNANGNFAWATKIGDDADLNGDISLAIEGSGNVYITGSFWGTADFDPGPGVSSLTGAGLRGLHDVFVVKLDRIGAFGWVKQLGGVDEDIGVSISADGRGNIYIIGNFVGTVDLDPGPGSHNLTSAGNNSYTVISKLDPNGNFIWARQLTGGIHWTYSGVLDNDGNIYTTGYFGTTVDFDPGLGVYNLSTSRYDVFISKLDANGDFVWARQLGGTATIISNSNAVDTMGNVFTTGYFFGGQIDFDPGPGSHYLGAGAGENIFVHKMSQCMNKTSSLITASVCNSYTLNGQTYNTSGEYTQFLTNGAGCDSIITLQLTINEINKVTHVTTCTGYTMNNNVYNTSGTYKDTMIATNGCDSIVTLYLTITLPYMITVSRSICTGQSYNGYSTAGIYNDTLVSGNGCDSIITLQLTVLPETSPYLGVDTSLCTGDSLLLYPGKFTTYTWQDGSAQDHITIKKPGLYSVAVTDNCGSATDEIIIKTEEICDIYFPNAFTPNNDGINDLFKIAKPANLTEYHLSVYNRWGQKVFETFDYSKGWNGSFNGQVQSLQTFVWYCEFKKQGHANRTMKKGMVTLIR